MGDFEIQGGELIEYRGEGGDAVIPAGVTSIGNFAFEDCTSLTSIVIPPGVTHIGNFVFRNCPMLRSVAIPEGVETIKHGMFYDCTSLTTASLPDSLTSIGYQTFTGCTALASVNVRGIRLGHATLDLMTRECITDVSGIIKQLVDYKAATYVAILTAFWHCPTDTRNNAMIRASFGKIARYLIDHKDALVLEEMLNCGEFDRQFSERIDKYIEYAITKGAVELQLMLTNYKAEKVGYADTTEHLKL